MTVTVPLPQGGYPVHIQPGALRQTGALLAPLGIDRWAVTADETVAALYGGAVLDSPVSYTHLTLPTTAYV